MSKKGCNLRGICRALRSFRKGMTKLSGDVFVRKKQLFGKGGKIDFFEEKDLLCCFVNF
jgi:hypothetical protein